LLENPETVVLKTPTENYTVKQLNEDFSRVFPNQKDTAGIPEKLNFLQNIMLPTKLISDSSEGEKVRKSDTYKTAFGYMKKSIAFNIQKSESEKDVPPITDSQIKEIYEAIGYKVLLMSIEKNIGIEEVKILLKDKTTLLSGHSGVGKSSFINIVFPDLRLKTQDVSGWSGKGLHTTTFAEMFNLSFGGRLIDTPGIRELGLVDIPKNELSHFFPEMRALITQCHFNNCMHINEPDCAVKEAVNLGSIHPDRYYSYLNILESIEKKAY
jgi:ribosome small subunit-dependent GTPase A